MRKLLFAFAVFCITGIKAQQFDAYKFYNKKGKAVKTEKIVKQLSDYDVVLFGELHNNSIVHWLQLKFTEALYQQKNSQLILGAEMFERDNQPQLDRYLSGKLDPKNLKDSVRLWNNYITDYKPLLDFAKAKNLKFIAGNIPRKYASQVAKQGLESLNTLDTKEKAYIATLPIKVTLDTPGYKEMKTMMGNHADDLKVMNFISAQAVKDATMAESIINNLEPGKTFVHYNGNYHSKEYGGIYWYLKQRNPNLKIAVISVFESETPKLSVPEKDYVPTDFNLIVPADMTKTY
ncbi:TPA: ChaN family lipoprotein [Elizabethkingia anophelis]|uniref:ChaN family lipoprotein n=1 Tax=Elizabethkingia anophelis TaxID=1117645 RepID=UPI00162AC42E|nr:ChaN family lipoprotein [Elizabethkingia anophelis]MCT3674539.1 ChaN family lipoprotein [Elizabethkingia anophelis]MCT3681980.1 ChaN family lipoprotein [Elizabethkingia anophelis]MCT3703849.1 ChaN family lipoprotein [Elizabethkingia anophelis]MCT3770401.1 ChaN family lipoprotein [Elizabethkingia anophelis]MCT3780686.1 ChaN family lipoprotein [Elizabethkingia anophelis]